ncbi:MAG: hypothetical protein CMJ58_18750 [Planctomycetaceae bacterium]|nr:hypothetical protein [Planctomycetaceae bacterium]
MTYTDQQFGAKLLAQLDQGYDALRIAQWADRVFLSCSYSTEVRETLIDIFTMQEGEEFHIPEAELRRRAQEFASA